MKSEQIESAMKKYNEAKGRAAYISAVLPVLKEKLDKIMARELAESAMRGGGADGMPRSPNAGDPTGRTVEQFLDGKPPVSVARITQKIAAYEKERAGCELTVKMVDAWMLCLKDKERWVIERQTIEGQYWTAVVEAHAREYGYPMGREGLKAIKRRAIEKIEGVSR